MTCAASVAALTTCDVDMLYKLMDIIKDTYDASKYAMEVADLSEHHDHPATPAK